MHNDNEAFISIKIYPQHILSDNTKRYLVFWKYNILIVIRCFLEYS